MASRAAQLAVGLSHDEDDVTRLEWGPVPDAFASEEEDESEYDVNTPSDELAKADVMLVDNEDPDADGEEDVRVPEPPDALLKDSLSRRRSTPPLPLSLVSKTSTPQSRKRRRTENWQPPEYIPDWLPPFPTGEPPQAAPAPAAPSDPAAMTNGLKTERPDVTSTGVDRVVVRGLPHSRPIQPVYPRICANVASPAKPEPPLSAGQQLLLEAYHHIVTHPPPACVTAVNPGRYRVALQQMDKYNRWDAPTTLYGSTAPNPPRVTAVPPSYAVPVAKRLVRALPTGKKFGEKEEEKRTLPGAYTRHIAPPESVTPMLSKPMSRIPALANDVLPVRTPVLRIQHPPLLQRGNQKPMYGPGVNAPWNSSFKPTPAALPAAGKGKDPAEWQGQGRGRGEAEGAGRTALCDVEL
ncbi:hypothetical protein OH76DRAFT_1545016 [Lentinus brumalis]|uniref:Uncharacterized protein n=1 Tax=Lentinus brumalis TaxID=2498619 RepID=A0A371CSW1_9APHY|nr:hypothetical protein OH76DRAFT_1545016 [Polyporus brumalis]